MLIFSDGRKAGLRAQTNRDEVREVYGRLTSGWIDKLVELYCDPNVRNPSGAKVGGIRIRIPSGDDGTIGPVDFTSDLETEDEAAGSTKGAVLREATCVRDWAGPPGPARGATKLRTEARLTEVDHAFPYQAGMMHS